MKRLIPLFTLLLCIAFQSFSQNSHHWEERADRVADWAERFAERVESKAERTADRWEDRADRAEDWAEDLAEDLEDTFDRDWDIHVNGERVLVGDICHAYLGIHSNEISREKAQKLGFENAYGSYVNQVVKGSAADQAGLKIFDYIYGIDDQRTSNNQDLSDIIADYQPGDEVTLHLIRNGESQSVQAIFGEYNDFDWNRREEAFLGVRPHADERGRDFDGVKVSIVSNSTADEMGLQNGDIILGLNDHEVLDWDDVNAAINSFRPGETVTVAYERNGEAMTATATIGSRYNDNGHEEYFGGTNENRDWDFDWDDKDWGDGDGAFLGIYTEKVSEKKARKLGFDNPYGTLVTGVIKGTGAHNAGLEPFDYIFGIDEYRVGENQSLGGILRKYEPGDEAVIHFFRKGEKQNTNLTFGHHSDVKKEHRDKCQDPFFGIIQIHSGSSVDGVIIKPVRNSTASKIGLEEDDIITEINGYPMYDWTDISTAIDMLNPGETISVKYIRDNTEYTASEKVMSYAESKNCDNCDCDNDRGHVIIDIDEPNIDIRIGGNERYGRDNDTEERVDIGEVDVKMEDVSSNDAEEMRGKGVDMSIESSLNVTRLELSPNPNIGMFELEFDLASEGETLVRVYNPVGRIIYEYDLGRFSGDFADNVDISQNGEGVYYLQITQGSKALTRKVVLSKN